MGRVRGDRPPRQVARPADGPGGHPGQCRQPAPCPNFARASGQLAKTDAVDAGVILRFARAMQPPQTPIPSQDRERLVELPLPAAPNLGGMQRRSKTVE